MMKKLVISFILTCIFIFAPAFMVDFNESSENNDTNNLICFEDSSIATFNLHSYSKKTYYIDKDEINLYKDPSEDNKVLSTIKKGDIVIIYKESGNFFYCENISKDKKGWVKKSNIN